MGLADYNRKRDFTVTAEPPGRVGATATGRSFVIQKHAASRLHYDFRLELDGVLKSWSVPKGPSFDPSVKRLAVEVEDHPIDYGDFEGIIPAGQYGGGTVLLWDRGTWSPVGDAAKSLAAGQLKFELTGEKLRGKFVLVKIKERPGRRGGQRLGPEDRSWLLIKERDEHVRSESEWSVTEAEPDSVATGRGMEAIAKASDRVWHSNRGRADPATEDGARAAELPKAVVPAEATRARTVPAGDDWLHEIAVAGERLMVRIAEGRARLLDARGRDRSSALAELATAAQALPAHQALVDGVATALGEGGLTHADQPANTLYVFDLLYLDGQDLTRVELGRRKQLLEALVKSSGRAPALRYTDHVIGRGDEIFRQAAQLGASALVSKRIDARYHPGPKPNKDWRIVPCSDPDGAKAARTKPRGGTAKARGSAKTRISAKGGVEKKSSTARKTSVIVSAASPDAPNVAGVTLTNPDRVLYPEAGVTKRDLARYYEAVAKWMLPYVQDRPLTLVRAPDGVKGKSFYVRHAGDWAPRELRQVEVPDGTGSGSTMIADDVAGLVALAQMNVLEIHAWNARVATIEQPDRMVFDLDPGPRVSWTTIVEGALHVRAALQLLELESFVKTTGSKGLHVVVPLVPDAGWKETLAFTHTVALAISRAEPRRYTAAIPKAGREDKILIDYLRNRRGATSVSIYSSRARPLAPVSVPVAWKDLGPDLRSDAFRVGDVQGWLRARKSDPWKRFAEVRQKLTPGRLKDAAALAGRL